MELFELIQIVNSVYCYLKTSNLKNYLFVFTSQFQPSRLSVFGACGMRPTDFNFHHPDAS